MNVTPIHVDADVLPGDRLGPLLMQSTNDLQSGDVIVVASKIVSKAEDRVVAFDGDFKALVRSESKRILRIRGDLVISETHHGFVCANAGIDLSNTTAGTAVLLPKDPDRSAHVLRNELLALAKVDVAVIVADTAGRAWREGVLNQAIGCAGIRPIMDLRGTNDAFGNKMSVTQVCVVDELAATSGLAMKKDSRIPFVIIRGVDAEHFGTGSVAKDVIRRPKTDLFR